MSTIAAPHTAERKITEINTAVGRLIPVCSFEPDGRKKEAAPGYYPGGELRSVPLDEATPISTPIGKFSAELVTFYRSGKLRRIFPLNGRISAYWTEADEYGLAETLEIKSPAGLIRVKPIYIQFYETGELQSVCFWPDERVSLRTPAGHINIRRGISFHLNGNIASCEPSSEVMIETPVGDILAYDPDAQGLSAESGSLSFYASGAVSALATVDNCLVIRTEESGEKVFSPSIISSYCDESSCSVVPLRLRFRDGAVICINNEGTNVISVDRAEILVREFKAGLPLMEAACGI